MLDFGVCFVTLENTEAEGDTIGSETVLLDKVAVLLFVCNWLSLI